MWKEIICFWGGGEEGGSSGNFLIALANLPYIFLVSGASRLSFKLSNSGMCQALPLIIQSLSHIFWGFVPLSYQIFYRFSQNRLLPFHGHHFDFDCACLRFLLQHLAPATHVFSVTPAPPPLAILASIVNVPSKGIYSLQFYPPPTHPYNPG